MRKPQSIVPKSPHWQFSSTGDAYDFIGPTTYAGLFRELEVEIRREIGERLGLSKSFKSVPNQKLTEEEAVLLMVLRGILKPLKGLVRRKPFDRNVALIFINIVGGVRNLMSKVAEEAYTEGRSEVVDLLLWWKSQRRIEFTEAMYKRLGYVLSQKVILRLRVADELSRRFPEKTIIPWQLHRLSRKMKHEGRAFLRGYLKGSIKKEEIIKELFRPPRPPRRTPNEMYQYAVSEVLG